MNPNNQVCQFRSGLRVADHENATFSISNSFRSLKAPTCFSSLLRNLAAVKLRGSSVKATNARNIVKLPSMMNKYCQFWPIVSR
jgi:hypothetical protein